jgi:Ca2+-binding EF-hand superfamily protein
VSDTNVYAAAFQLMDTDNDGLISAAEVKGMFEAHGETLTDETIAAMIGFMDQDGDGQVSLGELTAYLSQRDSTPEPTSAPAPQD